MKEEKQLNASKTHKILSQLCMGIEHIDFLQKHES